MDPVDNGHSDRMAGGKGCSWVWYSGGGGGGGGPIEKTLVDMTLLGNLYNNNNK